MPQSEERVQAGLETLHRCAHEFDLEVFHVREMPVDNSRLGPYAKSTEPRHYQIFMRDADSSAGGREKELREPKMRRVNQSRSDAIRPIKSDEIKLDHLHPRNYRLPSRS